MMQGKALFAAAILLVAAAVFGGIGWYMYQSEQSDIQNAVDVRGTVQNASVDRDVSRRDSDNDGVQERQTSFQPVVYYTYTYEGTNYTSHSVYAGPETSFDQRSKAVDVVDDYSAGQQVTVSVNSEDPSRAFLVEKDDSLFYFVFMGVGAVLGLAGVGGLVRGLTGGE